MRNYDVTAKSMEFTENNGSAWRIPKEDERIAGGGKEVVSQTEGRQPKKGLYQLLQGADGRSRSRSRHNCGRRRVESMTIKVIAGEGGPSDSCAIAIAIADRGSCTRSRLGPGTGSSQQR